jgi:hypothetical protein
MAKLFTCMAHADLRKIDHLARVLKMQDGLMDEVHVCIITNMTKRADLETIYDNSPPRTKRFRVEIYNEYCDKLPSPWLLTWVHKKVMLEKYQDSTYTHFMCIEDDMEVTPTNIEYWLDDRKRLKPFGLYPSFLRVEWSDRLREWTMTDSVRGDLFSYSNSPHLDFVDGRSFVNLPRTYQGMFFYDRELMSEHINSISFDLFRFLPDWRQRILSTEWPLGLTEAAVTGISHQNVPEGCYSRNFIPVYAKYLLIDPCCFVHHLPNKYTDQEGSSLGKVAVRAVLAP